MPVRVRSRFCFSIALLTVGVASLRCTPAAAPHRTFVWVAGTAAPAFDPDGPPDALRWSLERLLTRGLVEEDSSGDVVAAAAERWEVSADSLIYTFHLRQNLSFDDGAPCTSADFRRALESGLDRTDHATRAWLLGAVRGVDNVRAGRPLPRLGIATPDERRLVIELRHPDRELLRKLALPGVSDVWSRRTPASDWTAPRGLGQWRVTAIEPGRRLILVPTRARGGNPKDSIIVRFASGAGRVRSLIRAGIPDLVWPLPGGGLEESLPSGYRRIVRPADPPRRLLLVMRADLPPTSRLATRRALVHSINRGELAGMLGSGGATLPQGLAGGAPFEFPKLDPEAVLRWMDRGNLGRSFHVVMTYDQDGLAGAIARRLQGDWARQAIYADLKPLSGRKLLTESLRGPSHLILVEAQSLLEDPASDLAAVVMPIRGPAVGAFRTGWRTREFDPWITPGQMPLPFSAAEAGRRLEEEMVVLPLFDAPWVWVERSEGSASVFHPHFGPSCAVSGSIGGRNPMSMRIGH
jgi:hypothetical protein